LNRLRVRVRCIDIDAPLDLVAEMAQQSLYRPGSAIAKCTDFMALDLS
jgi:hypothetical protein